MNTLRVRSFKSIVDLELELGVINFFIGANGHGKSNLLESIGVLSAAIGGLVDDEALMRRGVRPGVPRLYKSAFKERLAPHIYFEIDSGEARYAVSLNNTLETPRPKWQFKTEDLVSKGERIGSRGPKTLGNKDAGLVPGVLPRLREDDPALHLIEALRGYAIYAPSTQTLRGLVPDAQNRDPVGLTGGNLAEAIHEMNALAGGDEALEEIWDEVKYLIDWIVDLDSSGNVASILAGSVPRGRKVLRFTDRHMRRGKNTLTAHDASEGALYILFLFVLGLHPRAPAWLAIDNVDQALNPRLLAKTLSSLCQWVLSRRPDKLMLLTLHNPAALDLLPLEDPRIRLFTVQRNNLGHTKVARIVMTPELTKLAHEKDWPLSRLWVMGHLGGVPNV